MSVGIRTALRGGKRRVSKVATRYRGGCSAMHCDGRTCRWDNGTNASERGWRGYYSFSSPEESFRCAGNGRDRITDRLAEFEVVIIDTHAPGSERIVAGICVDGTLHVVPEIMSIGINVS